MLSFRHIGWILVSIFLVAYLYYIHIFAVNIPITDDYDLVRVKYTLLTQKFSFWEKIQLLLEPENDHRILVPRSIALSATAIEGYVNYRTIIGVVNLCLFGILGLWFGTFRRQFGLRNYWYFVPVLVFYLNPYVFDVTLWGINGMQHTTLNLLVLGSLYVLSNHTRLFGLAIVLAVMSTFTNGNGFLVFAAGLLVLGLSKDWKRSAVWAAAMVMSIGFYFYKYSFGQATQVKLSVLFFQNLVVSFGALVAGWVASFKGQTNNYLWVAFGVGILLLGWLVKVLLWEAMRRFWQPRREERQVLGLRRSAPRVVQRLPRGPAPGPLRRALRELPHRGHDELLYLAVGCRGTPP
ncbi:MAG: hypothetical protein MUE30_19915 [Spirosomaceae bacterium]|nr:hypothetical protein [Spirosomataceae bacterium]